ncbi:hypothetical protein BR93DRAFT_940889 [Coniochaeta sp. PMI_546]|nr:hypothetical protein BR93DRAFT_940889 [Coniochaeta sp. PMI_546]
MSVSSASQSAHWRALDSTSLTPDKIANLDFNDKSSRRGMIIAINAAAMSLIFVFVSVRFAVRLGMTRRFFLDDVLICFAAPFTFGLCITTLLAMKYGFGEHVWNLPSSEVQYDVSEIIKLMFIDHIFGSCAVTFTKTSIVASYLRIFPYRGLRIAMYITTAVTIALFFASIFTTIFQCSPVAAAWNFTITDRKCFRLVNYLYASTAVNIVTDIILCTAPLPYFWNLQLPRRQKVIVSTLFLIGGLACLASIVRLRFLYQIANTIDYTWQLVSSVACTIAECTIGICVVSIPPIRPLLGKLSILGKLAPACVRATLHRQTHRTDQEIRQDANAMGYQRESATTCVDEESQQEAKAVMAGPGASIIKSSLTCEDTEITVSLPRPVSLGVGRHSYAAADGMSERRDEIWAGPPAPPRYST